MSQRKRQASEIREGHAEELIFGHENEPAAVGITGDKALWQDHLGMCVEYKKLGWLVTDEERM